MTVYMVFSAKSVRVFFCKQSMSKLWTFGTAYCLSKSASIIRLYSSRLLSGKEAKNHHLFWYRKCKFHSDDSLWCDVSVICLWEHLVRSHKSKNGDDRKRPYSKRGQCWPPTPGNPNLSSYPPLRILWQVMKLHAVSDQWHRSELQPSTRTYIVALHWLPAFKDRPWQIIFCLFFFTILKKSACLVYPMPLFPFNPLLAIDAIWRQKWHPALRPSQMSQVVHKAAQIGACHKA